MNINYISLGASCSTIYQINKFIGNKQTLFFDWLLSELFEDVIELFKNHDSIDDFLNSRDITILEEKSGHTHKIQFNKFQNLYSLHDLSENYTDNDILIFVNKTKKRYFRLIKQLFLPNQHIYFLRVGKDSPNINQKINFCNVIKKINPEIAFKLVTIKYGINYSNSIIYNESMIDISLYDNKTKSETMTWRLNHLDWGFVFTNIIGETDGF
jgi:hypothetical protein